MIGLDTNVLVRYLVQDDPVQSKAADRIIRQAVEDQTPLFLNAVVLCELVWVLESAYGYPKGEIADVLDRILHTSQFEVQDREAVRQALQDYRSHPADFADCLIGRKNIKAGCTKTHTFDRQALKLPGFSS